MDHAAQVLESRLYHVEEAAKILSIGRTKAYELIADGRLYAIHLGRATRVSGREIERFIRSVDRPEQAKPHKERRRMLTDEPSLFDPEPPAAA